MVNDKILEQLIQEFTMPRSEFDGKNYLTRRREWFDIHMREIKPLLDKEKLATLTMDEAQKIYNEMSVGGPKLYPVTFRENGIEKIKGSLIYLLHGEEPLEERFYNFMDNPDSEYRLNGVGRAFASTALFLTNSQEFSIWNGAVDGGLRMLNMLPKRERGEHKGKTYVKIVSALKELQQKCGLEDLSYTGEFLELIFHQTIGTDVLKDTQVLPIEVPDTKPTKTEEDAQTHLRMQYLLVKIGLMEDHVVWVAKNDKSKEYNGERFVDICLEELPHFASPSVLRIAESIDVIWFKKKTTQPMWFFEIEHTTSIYSGLLRLNDVKIDYPIPKACIVAAETRKNLFESQINRRTFSMSELDEVCRFMNYETVEQWYKSLEQIHDIKKEF
jgi:hypothetical protein